MSLHTETLDRQYLELSQITGARTQREIELAKAVERAFLAGLSIRNDPRFQIMQSREQWKKYKEVMLNGLLD